VPWDKSRRYLRRYIFVRSFAAESDVAGSWMRESRSRKQTVQQGLVLARLEGVNTNLKIFSGLPLACKRHPPFISAPCRPKPNLHILIHTRVCVGHVYRINISVRTECNGATKGIRYLLDKHKQIA
jgi:hypothetical protein